MKQESPAPIKKTHAEINIIGKEVMRMASSYSRYINDSELTEGKVIKLQNSNIYYTITRRIINQSLKIKVISNQRNSISLTHSDYDNAKSDEITKNIIRKLDENKSGDVLIAYITVACQLDFSPNPNNIYCDKFKFESAGFNVEIYKRQLIITRNSNQAHIYYFPYYSNVKYATFCCIESEIRLHILVSRIYEVSQKIPEFIDPEKINDSINKYLDGFENSTKPIDKYADELLKITKAISKFNLNVQTPLNQEINKIINALTSLLLYHSKFISLNQTQKDIKADNDIKLHKELISALQFVSNNKSYYLTDDNHIKNENDITEFIVNTFNVNYNFKQHARREENKNAGRADMILTSQDKEVSFICECKIIGRNKAKRIENEPIKKAYFQITQYLDNSNKTPGYIIFYAIDIDSCDIIKKIKELIPHIQKTHGDDSIDIVAHPEEIYSNSILCYKIKNKNNLDIRLISCKFNTKSPTENHKSTVKIDGRHITHK